MFYSELLAKYRKLQKQVAKEEYKANRIKELKKEVDYLRKEIKTIVRFKNPGFMYMNIPQLVKEYTQLKEHYMLAQNTIQRYQKAFSKNNK